MPTAVRAEGLGKAYQIAPAAVGSGYRTLQEELVGFVRRPFKIRRPANRQTVWALRDVSFEIEEGEAVGIIGRNGAGKSTLLKILSRITDPTRGFVEVRGRVGSLLEVGTGFHPELTGRENIFLNGAILGMRRHEISRRFDEIVAFADLDQYIDTPVKRYSSGMYTRLAFAVAAHLEPEILVVDEVLAVGDAEFQRKCLGKMDDIASRGRTVLFVSHQMTAVRRLCRKCVWLEGGGILASGEALEVIGKYEASWVAPTETVSQDGGPARFLSWKLANSSDDLPHTLTTFGPVTILVSVQVEVQLEDGQHGIALRNQDGQLMWAWGTQGLKLPPGQHEFRYSLPTLPLKPGTYAWHTSLYEGVHLLDAWYAVPPLVIGTPPVTHFRDEWTGVLNVPCSFETRGVGR